MNSIFKEDNGEDILEKLRQKYISMINKKFNDFNIKYKSIKDSKEIKDEI